MSDEIPTNVIKMFPASGQPRQETPTYSGFGLLNRLGRASVVVLWVSVKLIWPLAQWLVSADVIFHAALALWRWDSQGHHDGWVFLAHFAGGVALTWFATIYQPIQPGN